MPFSFVEIEERKTQVIYLIFLFLVIFYFFSAWLIAIAIKVFLFLFLKVPFSSIFYLPPKILLGIIFIALFSAVVHWIFSVSNVNTRVIDVLGAVFPDKEDLYHKKFINIVEEVKVASGGLDISAIVMPISAMNAFSLANFKNQGIIGVTEGLLARLNRAELEAVIAHEVAHIVSKDTLIKTVAVSIFGLYGALLAGVRGSLENVRSPYGRSRGLVFLLFMYAVLALVNFLGKLISCFVSRECEYRADAVAVKLVRDPLSLARALYKISQRWRGGGLGYDTLESIFIVNPAYSSLDEKEGFIANLFSTHPPISKRISILLDMAHSSFAELKKPSSFKSSRQIKQTRAILKSPVRWFANKDGLWQGPFLASELINLSWLNSHTFLRREGSDRICFFHQDPYLLNLLNQRKKETSPLCPVCFSPLTTTHYEGVSVYLCNSCEGVLVREERLPRILIREEVGFSEEVIRKAKIIENLSNKPFSSKVKIQSVLTCPLCNQKMIRNFYTLAILIEVDRCYSCKVIWFDKDELEILQYLVEKERGSII